MRLIIEGGLHIFFFILSKSTDGAHLFLGAFFAQLFFRILFSSASSEHSSQEELCLIEGSCIGVYASLQMKRDKC